MPTDEELIGEILGGSQAAMEVLVKRHYNSIFSYIYRRVGDQHMAYDLTQEVFIKMMKSIGGFAFRGEFKSWLFKIATNTCYDYFRSRGFKRAKSEVELDIDLVDENNNVWSLVSKDMERQSVKKAIDELPDYQKDAVILKFYHDLKIKDIAKITGSKEATVKSRIRQGLAKLKELLGRGEEYGKTKNRF